MRIYWVPEALENLEQEADYIAVDDPVAAAQVLNKIYTSVDNLLHNPSMGRPGRVAGTRELIVPGTRYIVPYRINADLKQLEILQVFHSSRRVPSCW